MCSIGHSPRGGDTAEERGVSGQGVLGGGCGTA